MSDYDWRVLVVRAKLEDVSAQSQDQLLLMVEGEQVLVVGVDVCLVILLSHVQRLSVSPLTGVLRLS